MNLETLPSPPAVIQIDPAIFLQECEAPSRTEEANALFTWPVYGLPAAYDDALAALSKVDLEIDYLGMEMGFAPLFNVRVVGAEHVPGTAPKTFCPEAATKGRGRIALMEQVFGDDPQRIGAFYVCLVTRWRLEHFESLTLKAIVDFHVGKSESPLTH